MPTFKSYRYEVLFRDGSEVLLKVQIPVVYLSNDIGGMCALQAPVASYQKTESGYCVTSIEGIEPREFVAPSRKSAVALLLDKHLETFITLMSLFAGKLHSCGSDERAHYLQCSLENYFLAKSSWDTPVDLVDLSHAVKMLLVSKNPVWVNMRHSMEYIFSHPRGG